jgi:hypothetical protein
MAAYHKVEVSLNTNAVEVGIPSPQTVNVTLPTIGPAGPVGSVGPAGPQGPQGVPGTGLEVLTTQGDLLYQGASTGQRLAIGTSGQVLKVANGIPAWGNESGAVTSVNGETGAVILDGSEIESSANDVRAAFTMSAFDDGDGIYYPLPDLFINTKPVYSTTSGYSVFFENARWHITDGSPITANIIESSDDDNAAWPWLSAWSGSVLKAKLADVVGRARDTFLFVGDNLKVGTSSGLPLKTGSGGEVQAGAFGTGAGQFSEGNHTHGNLTNDGKVGTTANLPLKTGTNGVIEAGSFGTAAGSFCAGDDVRLSDDRDPNLHGASHAAAGSDPVSLQLTQVVAPSGGLGPLGEGETLNDYFSSAGNIVFSNTEDFAASGSITTSGLTQATARILGRTTASTGSIEEIQIGSGLSLSAGELSATGGSGGGEVRSDFVSPYTYTGLADAGTSESTASWTIRRSEFDAGGSFVATLTASAVEWDDRLTASYA